MDGDSHPVVLYEVCELLFFDCQFVPVDAAAVAVCYLVGARVTWAKLPK